MTKLLTYREFAAQLGVPDEDVAAFCQVLPAIGASEEGLSPEELDKVKAELTNDGAYRASALEEGAIEIRMANARSAAEAAALAERLYDLPKADWRESVISPSIVLAFRRLATLERKSEAAG